jgi:protein SCO1
MRLKSVTVFSAALILSLVFCAALVERTIFGAESFHVIQFLPTPKLLPEIELENNSGELFSAKNFNQRWSLVFFGFTHCPDMCPLALQQLSALLKLLPQEQKGRVQVVFISLDPERDTREAMAVYTENFNSRIIGVRGAAAEIAKLSLFFLIDYTPSANSGSEYTLEHSGRIFIINPSAEYLGSFAPPQQVETMRADLKILMKSTLNDNQMRKAQIPQLF